MKGDRGRKETGKHREEREMKAGGGRERKSKGKEKK